MKHKISRWDSIKDNIKYSLSVSSISGVSYLSYDVKRNVFERAFWAIVIITMMTLATWQGLVVYKHYRDRPVIVTVDKANFDWELTFPTATICLDDLRQGDELKQILENLTETHNLSESLLSSEYDEFVGYLRDLAFKNYSNYEDYEPYASGQKKEYLFPHQYMEVLDKVFIKLDFEESNSELKSVSSLNFPFQNTRPVTRIFTEWGPCVVANPNISVYYTPQYFASTQPYEGYEPITYTINTLASMTIKVKGKLHVDFHAPNEVMDITHRRNVIDKQFGKYSKYVTDTVIISEDVMSLSVEQKKCRLPYEPNEPPLKHSPVYSFNLCTFECRISIAMKYCNCTPYYYRRLPHEPICNLSGLYCLSNYKDKLLYMADKTEQCPVCPQNCNVSIFRQSEITNGEFMETLLEMIVNFPNEIYVRQLSYSKTDLTVQIGGIFSLFMGCSLLSFVEILYSLSLRLLCGLRSRNQIKNHFQVN